MEVPVALIVLSLFVENLVLGVIVHKAMVGETAILPCPSDDKLHRFQYWQLKDDQIIGPWNNNQKNKYRYEVWSGRLIIRKQKRTVRKRQNKQFRRWTTKKYGVECKKVKMKHEMSFYKFMGDQRRDPVEKCFSKQILGSELRSETVELLVKRDWEDSFENDSTVNTYRAVIAVLLILMIIMIAIFVFYIRRRRSLVFQESREESPDELIPPINSKAVYKSTNISLTKPSTSRKKSSEAVLENTVVETDISTSFSLPN